MKSILVIGMGKFGHLIAKGFLENGHEVMIVDKDEDKVSDLVSIATSTRVCDCTKAGVLESIGVKNFDLIFVCMSGDEFQSGLDITDVLKELGAKRVISKASTTKQVKFLTKLGADEVIYPEKYIAEKWVERYSVNGAFDYIDLPGPIGIYEIRPLTNWIGKTAREVNMPTNYNKAQIIGIKGDNDAFMRQLPSPDYVFNTDEHLLVLMNNDVAAKLLAKKK